MNVGELKVIIFSTCKYGELPKDMKIKIHKFIMCPVVLYRHETWSLTLREKHRPRVFENRVLSRVFGAKRDKVMEEWRRLHDKELTFCTPHHILFR
jgi:hypothetical protein